MSQTLAHKLSQLFLTSQLNLPILKESSQRSLHYFQQPHAFPYLNQHSKHTHTHNFLLLHLYTPFHHFPQTLPKMIYPQKFTTLLSIFFIISCPFCISESPPSAPPPVDDTEMKCGSCPCKSSCGDGGSSSGGDDGGQELPILSPPPPSPPPPSLTYLSSQNCDQSPPPPPPAPRFIYVTGGEPGNVSYQTQPYNWGNYNSAAPNTHVGFLVLACLVALVVCVASS